MNVQASRYVFKSSTVSSANTRAVPQFHNALKPYTVKQVPYIHLYSITFCKKKKKEASALFFNGNRDLFCLFANQIMANI